MQQAAPARYVPPHRRDQEPVQQARNAPLYTHYRQHSQNACAVEAIRMAYETTAGYELNRGELKDFMVEKGIYDVDRGTFFHALDRVFDEFRMHYEAGKGEPGDVARALAKGGVVLLETTTEAGAGHVLVLDALMGQEEGRYRFQIRDPGGFNVENVDTTDPRLQRATGRFWRVW
ncbi:MAG TPA: hypothetical protein VF006_09695 [Longimicrobium sp.]